jgi:hypothetical protein
VLRARVRREHRGGPGELAAATGACRLLDHHAHSEGPTGPDDPHRLPVQDQREALLDQAAQEEAVRLAESIAAGTRRRAEGTVS